MANLAGRVLAFACGTEAQAVALMDNLINGLIRECARAAALQLKLGFIPGFCLLPGLGLGLGFPLHPRGVVAAGLPFGLLCRDTLRCLVRPREQLVQPRSPVVLRGLNLRARLWIRPGNGFRIYVRGSV
jgi:hypothetical protein